MMGRRRSKEENTLNLPPRCYPKHGAFWYVHRTGKWERLGTDVVEARKKALHYNDPDGEFGSVSWYIDEFLKHFEQLVTAGKKGARTLKDYHSYAPHLKAYFGRMSPDAVKPNHVVDYLEIGAKGDRSVATNREKALLSSMFSWLRGSGQAGIELNPCLRTGRNFETPNNRYVTHEEYRAVLDRLTDGSRLAVEMVYATLQRPEDTLDLTRDDIEMHNGKRVLKIEQNKTRRHKTVVRVEIDAEFQKLLDRCEPKGHLIQSRLGDRYTSDGIGSMIRRHCADLGIQSFGLQSIKAKGATDMYLRGVPVETIRQLIGHKKISTTEIYVKRHAKTISVSNIAVPLLGE